MDRHLFNVNNDNLSFIRYKPKCCDTKFDAVIVTIYGIIHVNSVIIISVINKNVISGHAQNSASDDRHTGTCKQC